MRKEKELKSLNKLDEDVAFFTSLLPHVQRMTPLNKMSFRIEVQKLVMERAYGVGYGSNVENQRGTLQSTMLPQHPNSYSTSIFPQQHSPHTVVPTSSQELYYFYDQSAKNKQVNQESGGPEFQIHKLQ